MSARRLQAPKPSPFHHKGVDTLPEMLSVYMNQHCDALYYEVLDMPLPEFQKLKIMKVRNRRSTREGPEESQAAPPVWRSLSKRERSHHARDTLVTLGAGKLAQCKGRAGQ